MVFLVEGESPNSCGAGRRAAAPRLCPVSLCWGERGGGPAPEAHGEGLGGRGPGQGPEAGRSARPRAVSSPSPALPCDVTVPACAPLRCPGDPRGKNPLGVLASTEGGNLVHVVWKLTWHTHSKPFPPPLGSGRQSSVPREPRRGHLPMTRCFWSLGGKDTNVSSPLKTLISTTTGGKYSRCVHFPEEKSKP